ncbi:MAG: hypothetical protein L0312_12785 [Acidobacteria bacterium]|nr:hypothetical protein [Acidobacteriota bacterium]
MTLDECEFRLARIERQIESLRRDVQAKGELLDTIASPPWKRFWWFLGGYRLWKVGRWYRKTKELK